jgi:hypothetical protein
MFDVRCQIADVRTHFSDALPTLSDIIYLTSNISHFHLFCRQTGSRCESSLLGQRVRVTFCRV